MKYFNFDFNEFENDYSLSSLLERGIPDSNETINDPAGKFGEALAKFHAWNRSHSLTTWAADELENLFRDQQYPGLGTIKKLSIMHHLELINQYLEGADHDHM